VQGRDDDLPATCTPHSLSYDAAMRHSETMGCEGNKSILLVGGNLSTLR
jgi:hypothetical protein